MHIQVLEDYREFQDFIVIAIPRLNAYWAGNLNVIEQMDLMRIGIFCVDVAGFPSPPYYLKNETGTFGMKVDIVLQEKLQMFRNCKRRFVILYRSL